MNSKIREQLGATRAKIQKNLLTKLGTLDRMFDPNKIQEELTKEFATERRAIVLKLLGVEISNYGISVDRNGLVQNFISQSCRKATDRWLIDELAPLLDARGTESLLSPAVQEEIVKAFDRELRRQLQDYVMRIATKLAEDAVKEIATGFKEALLAPEEDTDDHDH